MNNIERSEKKKRNFDIKRWIDRKLTANIWVQLGLFAAVFLLSLVVLILLYSLMHIGEGFSSRISMTMSDVFGADRFIQYAYGEVASNAGVKIVTVIACIVGAVIFQGLLVATLTNVIQTRADKVKSGDVSYKINNHILILGYNQQTPALIKQLETYDNIVVAVENDIEQVREKLEVMLDDNLWEKITLIHANRTSKEDLCRLSVENAHRIYIVGESDEAEHDERNMESYELLYEMLKSELSDCYVDINNLTFFNTLKSYNSKEKNSDEIIHYAKFHPYNLYELWARKVLTTEDKLYKPLDYHDEKKNICNEPDRFVHLAIVGWSEMGEAFASMATFLAHYPNFITESSHPKTKISILDANGCKVANNYVGHHSSLFEHCNYSIVIVNEKGEREVIKPVVDPEKDFLDIEFEFIEVQLPSAQLHEILSEWNQDEKQLLTITFCSNDELVNSDSAYTLPMSIYEAKTPIWIYQHQAMPKVFIKQSRFESISVFGGDDIAIDVESKELVWAKYLNHFYCNGMKVGQVLYDEVDVEQNWSKASIQDRWSSIYNVCAFRYKLRSVGLSSDMKSESIQLPKRTMEVLAELEHNRWNVEKLLFSFRAATPEEYEECQQDLKKESKKVKDNLKQHFIHPDIRRFQELGTDHKQKNIANYDRDLVEEMFNIMKWQDSNKTNA